MIIFYMKVIVRANAVKYGLAATVWTTNVTTLHKVSQKLHASFIYTYLTVFRKLGHFP
jgi:acyl-CoA reductase-like NAD-dependent aldehyde dehydrogenase